MLWWLGTGSTHSQVPMWCTTIWLNGQEHLISSDSADLGNFVFCPVEYFGCFPFGYRRSSWRRFPPSKLGLFSSPFGPGTKDKAFLAASASSGDVRCLSYHYDLLYLPRIFSDRGAEESDTGSTEVVNDRIS